MRNFKFGIFTILRVIAILGLCMVFGFIFGKSDLLFSQIIIFSLIPIGIIGAIWGHRLLGFKLSMMSVCGMVALTGVVVNDAIVLIERVNGYVGGGRGRYRR